MAKQFKFEVVTPERVFYSDEVDMIVFNREDGEMGVMADHMPMLVAVDIGVLRIMKGEEVLKAAIGEGFIEITDSGVSAIVDTAEWPDEIDLDRAEKAKKRAEDKLRENRRDLENEVMLKATIHRANSRIKIAKGD